MPPGHLSRLAFTSGLDGSLLRDGNSESNHSPVLVPYISPDLVTVGIASISQSPPPARREGPKIGRETREAFIQAEPLLCVTDLQIFTLPCVSDPKPGRLAFPENLKNSSQNSSWSCCTRHDPENVKSKEVIFVEDVHVW
jgi:hypothetical protein